MQGPKACWMRRLRVIPAALMGTAYFCLLAVPEVVIGELGRAWRNLSVRPQLRREWAIFARNIRHIGTARRSGKGL